MSGKVKDQVVTLESKLGVNIPNASCKNTVALLLQRINWTAVHHEDTRAFQS